MNGNRNNKPYFLGLDIGTNSVGWAVTDQDYNLCKFKRKDMWGIRLFNDANTAEDRRIKRNTRRRLQRQHQRIDLLQELFAEEIQKTDPTFFIRLNESRLYEEDKSTGYKHPLFNDPNYTDVEYYKEFPTIFHLRKELIDNTKKSYDIRLVYLALHHIVKNRGHFLIDGDLSASKRFDSIFEEFCAVVRDNTELDFDISDSFSFEEIMKDSNNPKSVREKKLANLFILNEEELNKEDNKKQKDIIKHICKLLVGNKGDMNVIVNENLAEIDKATSFRFSDAASEEFRDAVEGSCPETALVYDYIKALYDWSILIDILADREYISYAKVDEYEKHGENLKSIRRLILKYCDKKTYNDFFNNQNASNNYVSYIGTVKKNRKKYTAKGSRCSEEDFYKNLGKIFKSFENKVKPEDEFEYERIVNEIYMYKLLPLQRTKSNGVVPKQVNEAELIAILNNAREYIDFLNNEENGISVAQKIVDIFNFRIPYYVGPLSDRHRDCGANSWAVRKEDGYIYPWNIRDKIDMEASNEEFIRRMTNKCIYLVGEDVVPKNSILYSKYMVLNELNNLRIRNKKVSVELKKSIFEELFLKHTRVTGNMLLTFLKSNYDADLKKEELSGFDKDFKSNMNSYLDFDKKIFKGRMKEDKYVAIAEDIIKWITIYDNDSGMIRKIIEKEYPGELSEEQLKLASKLKYSGWGNFSEKFLRGINGIDKETGEQLTVMGALWETNCNLMQILGSGFTFSEEIKKLNSQYYDEDVTISYKSLVEDLYVSPANKRAIWQTIQIAEEINKVMGHEPEKIFIEMARNDEEKGDKGRKQSRKDRLIELYKNCGEDVRAWAEEIENTEERKFSSKKLYLYYTQMGKCMYTGERIDLEELTMSNSKWDIDHIYPQSRIMDDSLDNLVLVKKEANSKKGNEVISPEIQKKMELFWKMLLNKGFISKKKYDKLMKKGDFTDEELAGFINRQLVETRQSTKAAAGILERIFKGKSEIVYVKANLVSRFRNRELMELKSRRVNDYHHAKDAYLNIVVGNVYHSKFTSNPVKWMKENRDTGYSLNRVFYYDVELKGRRIWTAPDYEVYGSSRRAKLNDKGGLTGGTIDTVRETVRKNNVLYTEYTYCSKGELFNIQPVSKDDNASIPLKKGLDVKKYGGYKSPNTSFFAMVEFNGKKGERVRQIVGVPIYIANIMDYNPDAFTDYCTNVKGMKNVTVIVEKIKKNSLISVEGFPVRIRGENEIVTQFKNNLQLVVGAKHEETLRRVEKYLESRKGLEVSEKYDGFSKAELAELYDVLVDKLKTVFSKRPANQAEALSKYRDAFISLELAEQAAVINEILNMLRCDSFTTANLDRIGGGKNAGNMAISKNTVGKSKIVLINQSVTGLYENRIKL